VYSRSLRGTVSDVAIRSVELDTAAGGYGCAFRRFPSHVAVGSNLACRMPRHSTVYGERTEDYDNYADDGAMMIVWLAGSWYHVFITCREPGGTPSLWEGFVPPQRGRSHRAASARRRPTAPTGSSAAASSRIW